MKTFKQYLLESCEGNYVCIDSPSLDILFHEFGLQEPTTGQAPPDGDYHCTLMYSKESSVDCAKILASLKANFRNDYTAQIESYACFDSTPKEGEERDAAKSCIVAKLKSQDLHNIFKHLQAMGMTHSYPEFSPHVTLRYNMEVDEAHHYRDLLNAKSKSMTVKLANYKSQPINKDYV
jgi:2'-5' RNA ligase